MFARRTGWDLKANAITELHEKLRSEGVEILDLALSNPTQAGFHLPQGLLRLLSEPSSLLYEPHPQGLLSARESVSRLYEKKGASVPPEKILLTASTSEAYSFLLRLLADPGDRILVPAPGYPLFDYLAALNDLEPISYRLRYDGAGWRIDFDSLKKALTPRTRAVVVVHPNHPTGSFLSPGEAETLFEICRGHGLPLISDEVFAEYRFPPHAGNPLTLAGNPGTLTFALGGISKFLALPQMKLSWIAVSGPEKLFRAALARLEVIADTYLSANTPVQRALAKWLEHAPALQGEIHKRLLANLDFLRGRLKEGPPELLSTQGGWTALLRDGRIRDEEDFVLKLL
ncbi:MAG: pyridoxal phosphate-dependent aminotransferase [Candidatus Omnitrophica bacterium]|nr:pyridoxal phosphate-dependent aminotransferase [Candidatus Omnitrophota bacterium]